MIRIDPEKFRLFRIEKGFSPARLAKEANVAKSTVTRIERLGTTSEETLKALADILRISPLDVLHGNRIKGGKERIIRKETLQKKGYPEGK